MEKMVREWSGKTIVFPEAFLCKRSGKDIVCPDWQASSYKILVYTDSIGCTSCKLRMETWKDIISEIETLAFGNVHFLFFFHPKDERELDWLLKREHFDYPVFIDRNNTIQGLNHFPDHPSFQAFLLDRNNTVLAIGNPVLNPEIRDLYKQLITGIQPETSELLTTVEVDRQRVEISGLQTGKSSMAHFLIRNTGNSDLVISDIKTSCGCTLPTWKKAPVKPGTETRIQVEVKPEAVGYFQKSIGVYCNIKESVFKLTVTGITER